MALGKKAPFTKFANYVGEELILSNKQAQRLANVQNNVQILRANNYFKNTDIGKIIQVKATIVQNKLLEDDYVKVIKSSKDVDYVLLAKYNELQKKLAANKIIKEKNLAIKQEEQLRAEALKALAKEAAEVKLEGSEENQKL
ncbi:hypothetical protein HANVADRAFT_3170 [Hanseniaspora valbyensis NRRL Y-1626]|uniref:Uncharacterized protein n=1 Tax=Hanseniaspora valbyensis NRRL Y-1626 TaxID=766949 RepID=A0A1B7TBI8_9ASCO|nr:hypothetical protein HANVADRAFT_3170 [Hanseniaspora valbyensis NRRL Y-1626]